MEIAQKFTGDYRSEQHQLNGNNFYGPVSISAPNEKQSRHPDCRKSDPTGTFPAWSYEGADGMSGPGLTEIPSWNECLQSLRSEELNDREQAIEGPTEGTCEWLLESPEYLRWTDEHGLLLIRGKPGCGKSTLLKFALEKQMKSTALSGHLVLFFFFYASGTELQNGITGLFRSLLLQLLDQDDTSRATFSEICRKRYVTGGKKKTDMEWNEKELKMAFQKMVLECSVRRTLTIFVDAIDECRDQDRGSVINFFHNLKGNQQPRLRRPRICFACRPYPDGQINAEFHIRLEERNHFDIDSFLEQELRLPDEAPEHAKALKDLLRAKADGLFLWLVLVIPQVHDMTEKGLSSKYIQSEILDCPRELNKLYEGLLTKIEDDELLEACRLFQWICFSARPLSLDELRIGMNVQLIGHKTSLREYEDHDSPLYIANEAKMKKRMIHLSRGLVDMTNAQSKEGKALIGLCHETIKDFLLKDGLGYLDARLKQSQSLAKNANFQLANTCLQYLSTKEILIASSAENPRLSSMIQFLCYAANYWLSHAVLAETDGYGEHVLWPHQNTLDTWIKVCKNLGYNLPRDVVEGTTLMHIAAKHGLESLVRRIISHKTQENTRLATKNQFMLRHKHGSTRYDTEQNGSRMRRRSSTLDRPYSQSKKKKEYAENSKVGEMGIHYKQETSQMTVAEGRKQVNSAMANRVDKPGIFLEDLATENGSPSPVMFLRKQESQTMSVDCNRSTPFYRAAQNGHLNVLRLLLKWGTDCIVRTANNYGWTPLHAASENGHLEVVKFLYKHGAGADIYTRTKDGWTPLSAASRYGHVEVLKFLYDHGADGDINTTINGGWSPLTAASRNGHIEVVKVLLERGADITITNEHAWTPLHAASFSGWIEISKLLLENGAAINLGNQYGWTPLHESSFRGHKEMVKLLLEKGANTNLADHQSRTPLHLASQKGHLEVVDLLLKTKANFTLKHQNGMTPLNEASSNGHLGVVKLLLEKGADITAPNDFGMTPLYTASLSGYLELVKLLLERGADITATSKNGWAPINAASYSGHLEVVKLLVQSGADITVANSRGETPLHAASGTGHLDVVHILFTSPQGHPNARDVLGRTPLFYAAKNGHLNVVQFMILNKADVDAADFYHLTPLFAAVIHNHEEVVRYLITSSRPRIDFEDSLGRNLLWWAKRTGHVDNIDLVRTYAQQSGITLLECDPDANIPSMEAGMTTRSCDVCTRHIFSASAYYKCSVCYDLDICLECFQMGGRCQYLSHDWALHYPFSLS